MLLLGVAFLLVTSLDAILVGIIEKTQFPLGVEDVAASLVDVGFAHLAFFHKFGKFGNVDVRAHVHVEACVDGTTCHFGGVTNAMSNTFLNGRSIGADETIEAPLIAQHVGEQILVAGGGDSLKLVE